MKSLFQILVVALLAGLLSACKKDKNVLGIDAQPAEDALNASYSQLPVYAYTTTYDSIASINDRYKYLGINSDPAFGTTEVGLYVNANIPDGKTYISFGDDAHITSSEIILTVYNLGSSYVGDSTASLRYSVYPIATAPDPTKVYYTGYDHFHSSGAILGTYTGSYTAMNGKLVLRIPVDKSFASAILNNPAYLLDNISFQNAYKGFYIKCGLTTGDGIITEFDLEDDLSGFYLYYQNGTPSATKADKSFRFIFGGDNPVRYNTVKNNFQNANNLLVQQVLNHDTTKGATDIFLKGMGVTKARVYIPNIEKFADSSSVAVNRAEIIFHLDPGFYAGRNYTPAPRLCLLPADSIGREIYALDQVNATDAARYDGNYDVDNHQYTFNIARHVQAILTGKRKNCGFWLVVGNTDELLTYTPVYDGSVKELFLVRRDDYVERVVLAGSGQQSSLKPTFNLSYVKLPHDK